MNDTVVLAGDVDMLSVIDGVPENVVNIVDDIPFTELEIREAVREGWGVI